MKISLQWLQSWLDAVLEAQDLATRLTMAGLEVDEVGPAAPPLDARIVYGRVAALAPHPDARKLRVAQVEVGTGEMLQIVCGAPNVRQGLGVATALEGATLPSGLEIKRAELRGVSSCGMLCSASELGLAEQSSGLLELPAEGIKLGMSIAQVLQLDDHLIEIDLTPNRGDCLGYRGLAREVAALYRCQCIEPSCEVVPATLDERPGIALEAQEGCPRYCGRILRGLDPSVPTPLWMQERLRRSGLRSLGPLVDVTNYVMLELGQPMHAFDLDRLHRDGVVARWAHSGETMTLLNEQSITLEEDVLVIADADGPLAMAGIMGGEHSGVSDQTQNVLLEAAFFSPIAIAGRARRFGLHTDSSHRFERGVDPQRQQQAIERATVLLLSICGGEAGPTTNIEAPTQCPQPSAIALRRSRLEQILGAHIEADDIEAMLTRLGMTVETTAIGWQVTPPSSRFDITIEVDLIEEVGRIHGYQNLPVCRPKLALAMPAMPEAQRPTDRLAQVLIQRGYHEAINYSFVDPILQQAISPEQPALTLANPISSEMAVMRLTLWPGLVKSLRYNLNRQQRSVRLYEEGVVFLGDQPQGLQQCRRIGGIASGAVSSEQWGIARRELDFFDLKGDVEALLDGIGCGEVRFAAEAHPALHPGQGARIETPQGQLLGYLGRLHPELERTFGLDNAAFLFELDLDLLEQGRLPVFHGLSKFPSSRRDIALQVPQDCHAETVLRAIWQYGGAALREVVLFDHYRGDGVAEGETSLAFGLILQDFSRNLTDSEIDDLVAGVLEGVRRDTGAQQR